MRSMVVKRVLRAYYIHRSTTGLLTLERATSVPNTCSAELVRLCTDQAGELSLWRCHR